MEKVSSLKRFSRGVGQPRALRVMTMLLMPLLIAGVVGCDSGSRKAYQDVPEGVPANLGSPVPDPVEVVETKPAGQLPDFIASASDKIKASYQGAINSPAIYRDIPCYCGCAIYTTPHTSLESCYIKSMNADGSMTFTNHSLSCDICQGIAEMTVDGISKNTPAKDIRSTVFAKFKYTGIWTDTPPTQ